LGTCPITGRFAFLTNIHQQPKPGLAPKQHPSRSSPAPSIDNTSSSSSSSLPSTSSHAPLPTTVVTTDASSGATSTSTNNEQKAVASSFVGSKIDPESRGALPVNFLRGTVTPTTYTNDLGTKRAQYAGFNLLVGQINIIDNGDDKDKSQRHATGGSWSYISNNPAVAWKSQTISPGIYGVSNAYFNPPAEWFKVTRGKELFNKVIK
jgi:hypothetical protein